MPLVICEVNAISNWYTKCATSSNPVTTQTKTLTNIRHNTAYFSCNCINTRHCKAIWTVKTAFSGKINWNNINQKIK